MPRQGDGTYLAPSGVNQIVPGAEADADDVRVGLLDLGNEMTNSLATDGQSAMSGQLIVAAGSSSGTPAIVFDDDRDSGFYWANGTSDVGVSVDGGASALFGSADINLLWPTSIDGNLNVNSGDAIVDGDVSGVNATFTGTVTADVIEYGNGDSYPFPAGTRMVFQQTASPTGWLKETSATYNDAVFRCVNGTPGTGGSRSIVNLTIAEAEMPSHTHAAGTLGGSTTGGNHNHTQTQYANANGGDGGVNRRATANTVNTGGTGAHSHGLTITGSTGATPSSAAASIQFKYVDFIIATKT